MRKKMRYSLEFAVSEHGKRVYSQVTNITTDEPYWVDLIEPERRTHPNMPNIQSMWDRALELFRAQRGEFEVDSDTTIDALQRVGKGVTFTTPDQRYCVQLFIKQVRTMAPGRKDAPTGRMRKIEVVEKQTSVWREYSDIVANFVTNRLAHRDPLSFGGYHLVVVPALKGKEVIFRILSYPIQAHYVELSKINEDHTPNEKGAVLLQLAPAVTLNWVPVMRPLDEFYPTASFDEYSQLGSVRLLTEVFPEKVRVEILDKLGVDE